MRSRLIFCGLKWLQTNLDHLVMVIPQRHDTINVWGKSWIPKKNICRLRFVHTWDQRTVPWQSTRNWDLCAEHLLVPTSLFAGGSDIFPCGKTDISHDPWSGTKLCHEGECHGAREAYCTVADGPYISIQRLSEICHLSKGTIHWGFPYCYYQ